MGQLLGKGASIEAMNTDDNTPLHLAIENGHSHIVELFLEHDAPVEAMDKNSNTPLHLAAKCGHTGIVELLLWKGAPLELWIRKTILHRTLPHRMVIPA